MNDPTMHTHRTPDVALWDQYRALREQWTHEDTLVNHRVSWLILSGGLLFTAYRAEAATAGNWLALAFPLFGMLVAGLIGVAIHAALAASDDVRREFERAERIAELVGQLQRGIRVAVGRIGRSRRFVGKPEVAQAVH